MDFMRFSKGSLSSKWRDTVIGDDIKDFKQDQVWFEKGPSSGSVKEGWLEEMAVMCEEHFRGTGRNNGLSQEGQWT